MRWKKKTTDELLLELAGTALTSLPGQPATPAEIRQVADLLADSPPSLAGEGRTPSQGGADEQALALLGLARARSAAVAAAAEAERVDEAFKEYLQGR